MTYQDSLYSYGRFLWEVAVCSYTSQKVDYEIAKTSMSRMLNLSNVLQFVIHGLYYSPLPEKQFVGYGHQCSLHVALQFRYKLSAIHKEPFEKTLANVSLVANEFSIYEFYKSFILKRFSVIHITWCYHKVEQFSLLISVTLSSVIIAIIVCNSLYFNTIKLQQFSLITKFSSTYISSNSRYFNNWMEKGMFFLQKGPKEVTLHVKNNTITGINMRRPGLKALRTTIYTLSGINYNVDEGLLVHLSELLRNEEERLKQRRLDKMSDEELAAADRVPPRRLRIFRRMEV